MLSIRTTVLASAIALSAVAGGGSASAAPRGHVVVRHRPHVFIYGGYGFYHWYPGFYYDPGPYGYYGYPPARPDYAVVDTDISPEEATVYLDGERMGKADDFDGFPDYLTVSPGHHVLEFRRSGYQSLRIDLNAGRGYYYDIDRKLNEGRKDDTPRHETWGGGPARRRHPMQTPQDRRPDTDRHDRQMKTPDSRNPDDEYAPPNSPNPDDEYEPGREPNPDEDADPEDQPNPDEEPSPDDQPNPDE